MTEADLRIRVAELEGWTYTHDFKAEPQGRPPEGQMHLGSQLPAYPTDPRAWAPLLEKMKWKLASVELLDDPTEWSVSIWDGIGNARHFGSSTLGRAVCLAYIAWRAASGEEE